MDYLFISSFMFFMSVYCSKRRKYVTVSCCLFYTQGFCMFEGMMMYHWVSVSHISKGHTAFTAIEGAYPVEQCHTLPPGVCCSLNVKL